LRVLAWFPFPLPQPAGHKARWLRQRERLLEALTTG